MVMTNTTERKHRESNLVVIIGTCKPEWFGALTRYVACRVKECISSFVVVDGWRDPQTFGSDLAEDADQLMNKKVLASRPKLKLGFES